MSAHEIFLEKFFCFLSAITYGTTLLNCVQVLHMQRHSRAYSMPSRPYFQVSKTWPLSSLYCDELTSTRFLFFRRFKTHPIRGFLLVPRHSTPRPPTTPFQCMSVFRRMPNVKTKYLDCHRGSVGDDIVVSLLRSAKTFLFHKQCIHRIL